MGLFRGTINSRRQDTIAAVFDSLDEAKTGKIHYAALSKFQKLFSQSFRSFRDKLIQIRPKIKGRYQ